MPDAEESFADYQTYLAQVDEWPSTGRDESVSIWSMEPRHALSAYHKLLRWAERNPGIITKARVRYAPLAQALISQAVGSEVVFVEALETQAPPADPFTDVSLEAAYDALVELDAHAAAAGKPLHILTRARVLHAALTHKEDPTHVG